MKTRPKTEAEVVRSLRRELNRHHPKFNQFSDEELKAGVMALGKAFRQCTVTANEFVTALKPQSQKG